MTSSVPTPAPSHATLADWIACDSVAFDLDLPPGFNPAVDSLVAALGSAVTLLGFGEALHGGEAFLILRNRLFQRLVQAHGYTTIAIESSFPRGHLVDAYIAGRGPDDFDAVRDTGFSHDFGKLDTSRELVEWMRAYNADPAHEAQLAFYGFDSPTEMMYTDSPRRLIQVALDYIAAADGRPASRAARIAELLGEDAPWENPAVMMDPTQSIGRSDAANALRVELEDLIAAMAIRRPELIGKTGASAYHEAAHTLASARSLLAYHAIMAGPMPARLIDGLGLRDAMMAANLEYIHERERTRIPGGGKVLAFAHNSHLKRGQAAWQMGDLAIIWWPAGAQVAHSLGERYAVIGTALGASEANAIAPPEPGTLEALLTAAPGPGRLIPTHLGSGLPAAEIAALPTRSGSPRNGSYFPLTAQSFTDFDWLATLDSTTYTRGARPLP